MIYHLLNGDSLAGTFKRSGIEGEMIVCRECLIDGPVNNEGMYGFWNARAEYIHRAFNESKEAYYYTVKSEFDKLDHLTPLDEVNLWFENDLFCQTNMWFVVTLLNKKGITHAFRVCPLKAKNRMWEGFGWHTPSDLAHCFSERVHFDKYDFRLGEHLWNAYRFGNREALSLLSKSKTPCFPYLEEVSTAEIERKENARPEKTLKAIMDSGRTEFNDIFSEFKQREGIYGFGDLQVGQMLKNLRA